MAGIKVVNVGGKSNSMDDFTWTVDDVPFLRNIFLETFVINKKIFTFAARI